jgi:hypothetical protein
MNTIYKITVIGSVSLVALYYLFKKRTSNTFAIKTLIEQGLAHFPIMHNGTYLTSIAEEDESNI